MRDRLRVCALYPDLLNIYADRGNIAVLTRRAGARGHRLLVTAVGPGAAFAEMSFRPVEAARPGHPASRRVATSPSSGLTAGRDGAWNAIEATNSADSMTITPSENQD